MPGGNHRPQPLPWQPVGAYPVALRPGRRGSRCAPRQWSGRRQSPQKSSARGPEEAARRGLPGGAAARRVARKDGPAGGRVVVRLVSGPEGGRARKTRLPATRKRQPGGAYPMALRPVRQGCSCAPEAARKRQLGGASPVALRSEGGRVIVVSLGPVGVCPSAVRPECVPGGNRRPQPLLRQPVRERTAVAHGADSSERSPAKIARP